MLVDFIRNFLFWKVKLVVWAALAVVALCVVLMAGFLHFVDLTPQAEKALTGLSGRPVAIHGGLTAGLSGLMPSLKARDIAFDGWKIESLEVTVPFWHLRKGERMPLSVDIDDVEHDGISYGDLDAVITFDGKSIVIKPESGNFAGGDLDGKIVHDGGKLTARLFLEGAKAELFWPAYEGKVDARLDLTATGDTPDGILRTLSGVAEFDGGKGRLFSPGVNLWGADLFAALTAGEGKRSTLNCLVAFFDVRDGVAASRVLVLDTAQATVRGSGSIDLRRQVYDLLLSPTPRNISLVNLATPLRVRGTLDAPQVYPDPKATAFKVGGVVLGMVNPVLGAAAVLADKGMQESGDPCVQARSLRKIAP